MTKLRKDTTMSTAQHSTAQQTGENSGLEKLTLTSKDVFTDNISKIGQLFPEVLTEKRDEYGRLRPAIDFEKLKQFLSEEIVDGRESYEFTWVGKREAIAEAGRPTTKTLRPDLDESVDFENSENVFITGDNLEVLKILQESYLGKIDMIYIDPPYNTGQDFIYSDSYRMSESELKSELDILDENDFVKVGLEPNEKYSNRFHSKWLSMIYSRLKLAKNLLSKDGIIFMSIDDNELSQLKIICDEIFGESKAVATICVETSSGIFGMKAKHVNKTIVKSKDYVLVYAMNPDNLSLSPLFTKSKKLFDTHFTLYKDENLECSLNDFLITIPMLNEYSKKIGVKNNISNLDYLMGIFPEVRDFIYQRADKIFRIRDYTLKVSNENKNLLLSGEKYKIGDYFVYYDKNNYYYLYPFSKLVNITNDYKPEFVSSVIVGDLWKSYNEDMGNISKEGFTKFANGKKPIRLLVNMMKLINKPDAIVMDFFAGSGTTAHAVMELNTQDSGNRKFILCTLDENVKEKSEFNTIDQISRERIRRAAATIQEEHPELVGKQDFGFKAYKLDSSNFKDVSARPDQFVQADLFDSVSNIKEGRTGLDLLFQVMLTWGMELSLAIDLEKVAGAEVYDVDQGSLMACFEDEISEEVIRHIAQAQPLRAVFRDSSFANSADKINVSEIFKELSPHTKVKVV